MGFLLAPHSAWPRPLSVGKCPHATTYGTNIGTTTRFLNHRTTRKPLRWSAAVPRGCEVMPAKADAYRRDAHECLEAASAVLGKTASVRLVKQSTNRCTSIVGIEPELARDPGKDVGIHVRRLANGCPIAGKQLCIFWTKKMRGVCGGSSDQTTMKTQTPPEVRPGGGVSGTLIIIGGKEGQSAPPGETSGRAGGSQVD